VHRPAGDLPVPELNFCADLSTAPAFTARQSECPACIIGIRTNVKALRSGIRFLKLVVAAIAGALAVSSASASEPRSLEVKHEFQRQHPCPSTGRPTGVCPGYIKDHIVPLACGGLDSVANLQWQTVADAKAKDKWERRGCR
jgi:hypothetical protein